MVAPAAVCSMRLDTIHGNTNCAGWLFWQMLNTLLYATNEPGVINLNQVIPNRTIVCTSGRWKIGYQTDGPEIWFLKGRKPPQEWAISP